MRQNCPKRRRTPEDGGEETDGSDGKGRRDAGPTECDAREGEGDNGTLPSTGQRTIRVKTTRTMNKPLGPGKGGDHRRPYLGVVGYSSLIALAHYASLHLLFHLFTLYPSHPVLATVAAVVRVS